MPEIQRLSPFGTRGVLGHSQPLAAPATIALKADGKTCTMTEKPFMSLLNIRGDASDAAFVATVTQTLGMALPTQANTGSFTGEQQLLWLGPDEWLFKTSPDQADRIGQALRSALAGVHHAVVDVSSGYTTLVVNGPATPMLIARGCPLDLHPKVFGTHAVAQSHIAKASVVLVATEAGQTFEITVRRSFTRYLRDWLCAAADE